MLPILNESFWRDEAFSVLLSMHKPLEIIQLTAKDQSPPLYLLLLHFWIGLFGTTETAIRAVSLLFHFGTALIVFLFIKRITKSFSAALLTACAVLLNPFLLQYAFEARPYSLLAFMVILGVYFITIDNFLLAGIVLSLAILTHNFALFTVVSLGLWWVYKEKGNVWKEKRQIMSLFFFPLLTLLGWGGVLWKQWVQVGHGFWIKPVTTAIFLDTFESFSRGDLNYPSRHLIVLVSFVLVFFALSFWLWKKEKETKSIASLLFFSAIGPVVISYVVSALFAPIFFDRYLIASIPLLITLVGYSLFRFLQDNPQKKTVVTIFLSCYGLLLIFSSEQILNSYQKPAINWTVSQIISKAKPGDIIIPKDVLNYLETKWYVQQSGSNIPVFAYSPTGEIPFYIGSILYNKKDIITTMPTNKNIWQVEPDGGYKLVRLNGK